MIYLFLIMGTILLFFLLPYMPLQLSKKARVLVVANTLILSLLYHTLTEFLSIWLAALSVLTLLILTSYLFFNRLQEAEETDVIVDDGTNNAMFEQERARNADGIRMPNEETKDLLFEEVWDEVQDSKADLEVAATIEDVSHETVLSEEDEIPVIEEWHDREETELNLDGQEVVLDESEEMEEEGSNLDVLIDEREEPLEIEDEFDFLEQKRNKDITEEESQEPQEMSDDFALLERAKLFAEIDDAVEEVRVEKETLPDMTVDESAKNVVEKEVLLEEVQEFALTESSDLVEEIEVAVNDLEKMIVNDEQLIQLEDVLPVEEYEEDKTLDAMDQLNEEITSLDQVEEVHVVPEPVKPKRMKPALLSLILKELEWMKKAKGDNKYETTLQANLEKELDARDYYVFASLLRDHYLEQRNHEKFTNLMHDLRERYKDHRILLSEIDYYVNMDWVNNKENTK